MTFQKTEKLSPAEQKIYRRTYLKRLATLEADNAFAVDTIALHEAVSLAEGRAEYKAQDEQMDKFTKFLKSIQDSWVEKGIIR